MKESPDLTPEPWPFRPSDEHAWPTPEEDMPKEESAKALFEAKLSVRKARTDEEIARSNSELSTDLAIEQEYFKSLIEVAKGSLDRTRTAAETVQKAAGAIVTIYTGVLALAFSVSERPLPPRALYAALLLGIAIVLSTAFVAYLPDSKRYDAEATGQDVGPGSPEALSNMFIKWSRTAALDRAPWLRASVIALGVALVFLPAPFISSSAGPSVMTQVAWPRPNTAAGNNPELQKILYAAQVDEAREARQAPIADDGNDIWWFLGFLAALALIGVLPSKMPGAPSLNDGAGPPRPGVDASS